MGSAPVRILVADDNAVYRGSICSILRKNPQLQVIAEVEDGWSAVEAAERHRPIIVLMDINMPILDGLNATRIIKLKFPEIRIIICSVYSVHLSKACITAGASVCIDKGCSAKELIQVIIAAAD